MAVLYIDYEQAYNSINTNLLYSKLLDQKVLPKAELDFLFYCFTNFKLTLGKYSFEPGHGVPQGGITSPILFNWAMYFMLKDIVTQMHREYTRRGIVDQFDFNKHLLFLWADDLAWVIKAKSWEQIHTKLYAGLQALIHHGKVWGLRIKWTKSALQVMLADQPAETIAQKLAGKKKMVRKLDPKRRNPDWEITIDVHYLPPNSLQVDDNRVMLPLVRNYKYLGITLDNTLNFKSHIQKLKRKITFITNAFYLLRKSSNSTKFCHGVWTTFIRPLLDYSQSAFAFASETSRDELARLYRTSMRGMMFLCDYTPINLVDSLIAYNYKNLMWEYYLFSMYRTESRAEKWNADKKFYKLRFEYRTDKISRGGQDVVVKWKPSTMPIIWAKIINSIWYVGNCSKCKQTIENKKVILKKTNPQHMIEEHINPNIPGSIDANMLINYILLHSSKYTNNCDISNSLKIIYDLVCVNNQ